MTDLSKHWLWADAYEQPMTKAGRFMKSVYLKLNRPFYEDDISTSLLLECDLLQIDGETVTLLCPNQSLEAAAAHLAKWECAASEILGKNVSIILKASDEGDSSDVPATPPPKDLTGMEAKSPDSTYT